ATLSDRVEVHPMVFQAMDCLRTDPRCGSTALKDLINLVHEKLLKIESEDRLTAADLHERLQAIFKHAQNDHSYLMNPSDPPQDIPPIFRRPPLHLSPQSTFQSTSQ